MNVLKLATNGPCETGNAPNAEKLQKVRNQGRPNDHWAIARPLQSEGTTHMTARLRFRDGFWQGVTWSRPDSPSPALCSKCSGALPEVPLMLWRDDHSAVSFCDGCVETWIVSEIST